MRRGCNSVVESLPNILVFYSFSGIKIWPHTIWRGKGVFKLTGYIVYPPGKAKARTQVKTWSRNPGGMLLASWQVLMLLFLAILYSPTHTHGPRDSTVYSWQYPPTSINNQKMPPRTCPQDHLMEATPHSGLLQITLNSVTLTAEANQACMWPGTQSPLLWKSKDSPLRNLKSNRKGSIKIWRCFKIWFQKGMILFLVNNKLLDKCWHV